MLNGFARVTRTSMGKTGIGLEVEVAEMKVYGDLTKEQKAFFKENGYRWMKALYELNGNGEWVKTRNGFFYKSFDTEAKREKEAKVFEKKLVKTSKPETKSTKTPEVKKPSKSALMKMTKAQLVEMLASK